MEFSWRSGSLVFLIACQTAVVPPAPPVDSHFPGGPPSPGQILHHIHLEKVERALDLYGSYKESCGGHDVQLLESMAQEILKAGADNFSVEDRILSCFGAALSGCDYSYGILEGLSQDSARVVQAAALRFLVASGDSRAVPLIKKALSSPFLHVRLEALAYLSSIRDSCALEQIDALFTKLPENLRVILPPFYSALASRESVLRLKRLILSESGPLQRVSLAAVARHKIDELLPAIHSISKRLDPALRELAAYAFGQMQDTSAKPFLLEMSRSSVETVRLAALGALQCLEASPRYVRAIEEEAKLGSLFAISMLGEMEDSKDVLHALTLSHARDIRTNAAVALCRLQDERALPVVTKLLLSHGPDLGLIKIHSKGGVLMAYRTVPNATQLAKQDPKRYGSYMQTRHWLLEESLDLPENSFLELASELFEQRETALVPLLVKLLNNLDNVQSQKLLKKYSGTLGSPLIRHYCRLGLLRTNPNDELRRELMEWILAERSRELIRFDARSFDKETPFVLSPEQESQLFVESVEAIAEGRDLFSIGALIKILRDGNPKNRPVIAGILLRVLHS